MTERAIYVIKKAGPGLLNHFYVGKNKFTDSPAIHGLKTFSSRYDAVQVAKRLSLEGHAVRVVYYPDGL